MRDVGKRTPVDDRRIVLECLHQVRRHGLLQQHRHGAVRLELPGQNRFALGGITDDDVAEPLTQILEVLAQAQDSHHFRGHDDVESILARIAVAPATQMNVVVDQGRQQIIGLRHCREVAGEMEIDVLHRRDLRVAAARCPALEPEDGAERGFAQANDRALADVIQRIAQADGGRGLALARRCR